MNIALIIAGGIGTRMHQNIPKQFLTVNEKPIIIYTLEAFQNHPEIDSICVACLPGWDHILTAYAAQYKISKLSLVVPSGSCREESIRNGLFKLEETCSSSDIVIIHDSIRPLVSAEIISDCIVKTQQYGCGIAAIPCADAMIQTENGIAASSNINRDNLRRTQTPHGFTLGYICDLQRKAVAKGISEPVATCNLLIDMGEPVYFSSGSEKNLKLTTLDDLDIFKALLTVSSHQ